MQYALCCIKHITLVELAIESLSLEKQQQRAFIYKAQAGRVRGQRHTQKARACTVHDYIHIPYVYLLTLLISPDTFLIFVLIQQFYICSKYPGTIGRHSKQRSFIASKIDSFED